MAESQDAEIFKFPASFLLSTASDIITVKIRNKKMQISKKVIAFFFHNFYNTLLVSLAKIPLPIFDIQLDIVYHLEIPLPNYL